MSWLHGTVYLFIGILIVFLGSFFSFGCLSPHSINYEETGTGEGLWDCLGGQKMTSMSFSGIFKA